MEYDVAAGELVPGDAVKCGNRLDLPKKQRRHTYTDLGIDSRNSGPLGYVEGKVFACTTCGADKFSRSKL